MVQLKKGLELEQKTKNLFWQFKGKIETLISIYLLKRGNGNRIREVHLLALMHLDFIKPPIKLTLR
jgi:hypothetical protein